MCAFLVVEPGRSWYFEPGEQKKYGRQVEEMARPSSLQKRKGEKSRFL